jgi:hypothetical protein
VKKWIPLSVSLLAALALAQIILMRPDARQAMEDVIHRAADAAPRAGTAAPDAKVSVLVVSDAPGSPPIRNARFEGAGIREKTGPDGRAELPNAGILNLRILANGFVGRLLSVDLALPDQTIVLKRTGSARFAAVDSDNKPVEGLNIRVTVLDREPSHILPGVDPLKTTGPDGVLHWSDLAPGAKAQWECVSGHPLEGDSEAKGEFTVAGGETYTRTLKVRRTSTIRGRLDVGPDASGVARVEVWTPDGAERQVEIPVGAAISIPNLTPGPKSLRAGWWDAPGRRVYARADFELGAGESRDVGTLPRLARESLTVKPGLRGPVTAVERLERPARATVFVRAEGIVDQFDFEMGGTLVLSGLPSTIALSIVPDFKFTPGASVVEVLPPPQADVRLPHPTLHIGIGLAEKFPASITLRFPGLARQTSFTGFLLSDHGRSAIGFGQAGPPAGSTSARFDVAVPPGTYEVLVRAQDDLNLYATGTLNVGRDGAVESEMSEPKPGAILRGRAVTKSGEPYRHPVAFKPTTAPVNGLIYTAEPDGEGRFTISGIVPNSKIVSLNFDPGEIVMGDAGTEVAAELTARE